MTLPLPPGAHSPDRLVWMNGVLARGDDAALSVFDRGARDGAGLFETVRVYDRRPFAWERHVERLVLSAAELGFPVPPSPSRLRAAVDELLAAQSLRDAVARVTVTRGIPGGRPTRAGAWIEVEPLASRLWRGARAGDARAVTSPVPFEPGALGRHKTTSRLAWDLARELARAEGADETLLASPAGELLEGAASNLFVVGEDGGVVTPPLSANVLPGVTRALVIGLCAELGIPAREAPIPLAALPAAREAFVTNSVQEVVPLARVDDRALPSRAVGERLLEAYRARVAAG